MHQASRVPRADVTALPHVLNTPLNGTAGWEEGDRWKPPAAPHGTGP